MSFVYSQHCLNFSAEVVCRFSDSEIHSKAYTGYLENKEQILRNHNI